ncbi:hypothetical protein BN1708_003006 [Verticillium longisporum]|uniref:Aquaporin n=1 Tax=Verticillium longisporum TaxID=100787 RepID=A0A0G4L7M8_VERLO|nr:hypothetical protein BN1708_003006 [Verticillium longisporum]
MWPTLYRTEVASLDDKLNYCFIDSLLIVDQATRLIAIQLNMGAQDIQEEHFNRAVDVLMEKPPFWSRVRCYCQDGFSEFIWTFILVLFGDGVVAQVVLSRGTKGEFQSINWGWGIGVMMGVYCGGKVGGHINPVVTLANCVFRGHP